MQTPPNGNTQPTNPNSQYVFDSPNQNNQQQIPLYSNGMQPNNTQTPSTEQYYSSSNKKGAL
jgi:hypothetical protein